MGLFKTQFLGEAVGYIKGSGADQPRHERQYITPHLGSNEFTHTLGKEHNGIPEGAKLKFHKAEHIDGVLHVHATDNVTGKKTVIPVSKIKKPGEQKSNKGFDYENNVIQRLKSRGLMEGEGAGFTSGTDFNLINKKKGVVHKGKVHHKDALNNEYNNINGETKAGKTAAFGQATIAYHPDKGGWHIPDSTREKRPGYCKHIESTGIIDHMNEHHHPEGLKVGGPLAKNVTFHHDNLDPAKAYLQDHHVDVLQVGGHGTYKVGEKDKTGHGLPEIEGTGQWRVRQKTADPHKRTVQFMVKHAKKSHVDLDNDEHLDNLAKTLGHK
jgi:hypothetical protein